MKVQQADLPDSKPSRFQNKIKDADAAIEPSIRYRDIDRSEIEYDPLGFGWIEPANETTEIGVQLLWIFEKCQGANITGMLVVPTEETQNHRRQFRKEARSL